MIDSVKIDKKQGNFGTWALARDVV